MKITYSYLDDHGEVVTTTEINPGMVVSDSEKIDQGIAQREAEHHAAQPAQEQSPYSEDYPDEGGMFWAIAGVIFLWAIAALVVIAIAQGAL